MSENERPKKKPVLLLNADQWTPLDVIDFNDAILNIYKDAYKIKVAIPGQFVQGPTRLDGTRYTIPWPVAVYVNRYVHIPFKDIAPRDPVLAKRMAILHRDEFTCQYCGDPAATWDHVWPQDRGGENTWLNTVAACGRCNSAKANYTLEEIANWNGEKLASRGLSAPLKLMRQPFVPDHDKYRRSKKDVWEMLKTGEGVDLGE